MKDGIFIFTWYFFKINGICLLALTAAAKSYHVASYLVIARPG
jgi:hypothetical protein